VQVSNVLVEVVFGSPKANPILFELAH